MQGKGLEALFGPNFQKGQVRGPVFFLTGKFVQGRVLGLFRFFFVFFSEMAKKGPAILPAYAIFLVFCFLRFSHFAK